MLNVILADDEPIIIRGLKKLIPWEELGMSIVGEAWTGKELLELIEREQPDLVVTDISMPDGSGIDVIREVTRRQLRTKVIFISAYQEFSYAKDALAYGAVDYLVKPVEKGLLMAAVQKAAVLLQEETEGQTSKGKLAAYEQKDKQTQLEELFDRLIEGDIRAEEAQRRLDRLDADYSASLFTVFVIEHEPQQHEGQMTWGDHEKRLLLFAVSNLTGELARAYGSSLVLRKADTLCVIVNHREDGDMQALGQEMAEKVRLYLKTSITLGAGRAAGSLLELKASYQSAADALKLRYFVDHGPVIHWQTAADIHLAAAGDSMQAALTEAGQLILQALLIKDAGSTAAALEKAMSRIEALAQGSKEAAVTGCYKLLTGLAEELSSVGIAYIPADREQLRSMHQLRRYTDLKQYVQEEIMGILSQMQASGGREAQQMTLVREYIEKHYSENITLERMAALVYMNPYYFSTFFKKHTQQNFKQYVTEVRMRHAVRLLLHTDLMVYEIAEQVGYNNARQFSDMFKKQFGKLPQDYKNQKN